MMGLSGLVRPGWPTGWSDYSQGWLVTPTASRRRPDRDHRDTQKPKPSSYNSRLTTAIAGDLLRHMTRSTVSLIRRHMTRTTHSSSWHGTQNCLHTHKLYSVHKSSRYIYIYMPQSFNSIFVWVFLWLWCNGPSHSRLVGEWVFHKTEEAR